MFWSRYKHLAAAQRAQVRGIGVALAFAMCEENNRDWWSEGGLNSDDYAGQACASVFGRDEVDDSGFVFTQSQVDSMVNRWSLIVAGQGSTRCDMPH